MELTEEMLRLLETGVMRATLRGAMVEIQPDIFNNMIAEIRRRRAELERLQAENAALREALEEYRAALLPFADCYQNEVPESDKSLFKNRVLIDVTVEDLLRAAMVKYDLKMGLPDSLLNAKPDAAKVAPPAREIAVGDEVRVLVGNHGGEVGRVMSISIGSRILYGVNLYTSSPAPGENVSFYRTEIEPA